MQRSRYCGGADASVSVRVTVWSEGVTQVSDTLEPPRTACRMFISEAGEDTDWLFTLGDDVARHQSCRGSRRLAQRAEHQRPGAHRRDLGRHARRRWLLCRQPFGAGLSCPNCCSLASCCRSWTLGLVAVLCAPFGPLGTSTPTKPEVPIWTPEPACPAMICLAMVSALLIGIAKPTFSADCW